MTNNDKAATVAEKLLGWEKTKFGPITFYGEDDILMPFKPYERADDDYLVLNAFREKCHADDDYKAWNRMLDELTVNWQPRAEASGLMRKHCSKEYVWAYAELFYEPGDYTDAAYAVLKDD